MKLGDLYKELLQEAIDRNKIINAINKKQMLTIYYKADREENEVTGWRRIEPFCCGINKYGNPVLRAWQVSGVSNTYPPGKDDDPLTHVPGWRMFRMDKIVSLAIGWDKFTQPRPKYNPNDKDMVSIFAFADFGGNKPDSSKITTTPPVAPIPTKTIPQQPAPVSNIPAIPKGSNSALPQPKPVSKPKQSYVDKLTDKFKKLINYRPR